MIPEVSKNAPARNLHTCCHGILLTILESHLELPERTRTGSSRVHTRRADDSRSPAAVRTARGDSTWKQTHAIELDETRYKTSVTSDRTLTVHILGARKAAG